MCCRETFIRFMDKQTVVIRKTKKQESRPWETRAAFAADKTLRYKHGNLLFLQEIGKQFYNLIQMEIIKGTYQQQQTWREQGKERIIMKKFVYEYATKVYFGEGAVKEHLTAAAPRFAILDPSYTASVPKMQVISGAFDTLSHAMETYFGHSDPDNVSDDVALAIMRNTVVNMKRLMEDVNDMQARGNLMWDSAMAENGILKVGRVTDFQAHQMEHQLGAYTDCNHGQGLAVIHPAYYRHIMGDAKEKFTRFAKEVFGADTAKAGVDALADFIRSCGLPTKMGELKSKVAITPEVLRNVADTCNVIKSGPRELSRDEIYDILMECM